MKLNFIHVCDTAFLSSTNNLNIIGIFDRIFAANFPAIHPRLTIVANVGGTSGQHDFQIKIFYGNGKEIAALNGVFSLDDTVKNFGIISTFNNLKFPEVGVYTVEIDVDSKKIGKTNFEVQLQGMVS